MFRLIVSLLALHLGKRDKRKGRHKQKKHGLRKKKKR